LIEDELNLIKILIEHDYSSLPQNI